MERIGILGGGQLARMLVQAAIPLGLETTVLATRPDDPAALVARTAIAGDWNDREILNQFANHVDVVILENEFIGSEKLDYLDSLGKRLVPNAHTLRLIEDKVLQKRTLEAAGLGIPPLAEIEHPTDLVQAGEQFGWPLMLKTRRNGYDGRGTYRVNGPEQAEAACKALGWPNNPLYVEAWVPFQCELATLVIRSIHGETCVYPVIETIQPNGVCRVVRAPAPVAETVREQAARLAVAAAEAVGAVGILAVEMFYTADGRVLVNEMAPRPHNTGHYSIEGCYTSQFENALRAAIGWPLGDPSLRQSAAVMVNILAPCARELDSSVIVPGLQPQVHVHWYDKREARVGRKIGHITAVGADLGAVEQRAQMAVDALERAMCGES